MRCRGGPVCTLLMFSSDQHGSTLAFCSGFNSLCGTIHCREGKMSDTGGRFVVNLSPKMKRPPLLKGTLAACQVPILSSDCMRIV
mmetsp:Transcript_23405/g.69254  ORF Transcript_23405/g.69254 Transcript_23405/m.69254 type:complete len:85 (+) Transcript_23405:1009-1263(+)